MSIQSTLDRGLGRMWPKTLFFLALFLVQVSCQYKNSLTFVIDDTGSMGSELAEVKKATKSIVDIVLNEKASQIEDIVLVTFNDQSVAFRNRTRNADVFKQALDQVHIHDGNCSAKSLTGIELALEESLPGSYLFVFTDAGSNDLHLLEKVISKCREKHSQIVLVLTENNCETTAENYYRIARASNGQVFIIPKEQIGQVIEYVKESIKGDQSVITNQMAPPRRLTYVKFYIDDNTEYAIVSASGVHVFLEVKDNLNRDLISGCSWIMRTENVKVLKLANIRNGTTYVAQVYGNTNVNVMVFAPTDFTFGYFFSKKQEYSLSTTETQPTIGTPTHLMILVRDAKNSVTAQAVQILDMDEKVLANLMLINMGGKVYATERFEPPEHTFKVVVMAIVRSTRRPLRRIAKTPIAPIRQVTVSPEITDSEPYLREREGSTVDLPCRIRNGKPKPSITWFFMKKGTSDYVQMKDRTDDVLHLTNVLIDDEGYYKCEAENTVGRAEHVVQLEVDVAPKISDSERYFKKTDGDSVDIHCRILQAKPQPQITWFFMKKGTSDYVQMRDITDDVLHLTNVLMDNEGHYKCEAENTVGRAEHIVQLEVEVAPKIADSETYLMKREGSIVDIDCRIQKGNPRPNIRWSFMKKGTRDYVQMRDITNDVLRLTNVLIDNEGHYKCEVENTAGRAEHIVQLEVEVAPMIDDSETYLKKREGSTVDISCRIQKGNPRPNIEWWFKRDGATVYKQLRDATNEVLPLTNVLMDNEGYYMCVAENTVGRAEHILQLEVEVAPKISDSERYFEKTQGDSIDIHCRILQAKPQPQITWFFKQQGTRTFELLRDKTEQILHLTNIVIDNAGDYKCVAENVVNRAEHVVQLEVQVPPRIVFSPPNEPKYRGVEGDIVLKLSCIAEGHPKPIISWTIDNYTIGIDKSNQSYVEDGTLYFKNPISANSINTYVCVATNAVGEHRQTYEVLISEFEDYNQPEKMYGVVGKPYEINCSLPFTDPNSVRWFYNSVYLNVTGASIGWESPSQANDGNYTCRVSDLSGVASVTVDLTFGLPPTPSFDQTEFEVEWDDMLQVACMADLNMIGTYEWYRNGERIKGANEREINVHQLGWGNYTCRAANHMGSLNITYNIPSRDCVIEKNLWTTKKMPVIIDNTPAWPTFSHNQKFVVVPQSEKLHLVCQDDPPKSDLVQPHSLNNSFTEFLSIRSIEATCDHEDTFLVDGVSHKISELDCILPVTPSVVSTGKQCLGDNTQMIDVGFYVDDLIKVYSSCVDTNSNLLLYTTVNMKGSDIPREAREPETPCKQVADCCYETIELVSAEDVGFGAAEWATLKEPRNSVFYCRPSEDTNAKHVTTTSSESWSEAAESSPRPSAHTTENPYNQRSTTDLPSEPETSWHDIEREVRSGPRMTVWSGAGNYTRVGDMMVPQYLWKVVKNLDDDMTVAIVHSNTQAPIPWLCADDCLSPSVLALFEPHGFRTYCCSLDEFKTAFKLPLAF